jgi:hypothetical protein
MIKPMYFKALFVTLTLLFGAPLALAQQTESVPAGDEAENAAAEEKQDSSSQAVEINEDTYRQFMELKDANRQGDIIPETVYKPGSGLQKLDKLPEESQKHLRNELREIIVDGDPWQPGDENVDYPYTPSEAASKNPALQKQEKEAWGELVDSYNQREAQIYADRAGNRAAMSPGDGNGEQPGSGANKEGKDGDDMEGVPGQEAKEQGNPERDAAAGAFSPDAVKDPNAQSESGVSQNALQFLQNMGSSGNGGSQATPGAQQPNAGQPGSAAESANRAQAQTGQGNAGARDSGGAAGSQDSAANMAGQAGGTSQNAMKYLEQTAAQGQQSGQDNGQSTAQNSNSGSAQGEQSPATGQAGEQGKEQAATQGESKTLAEQQAESAEKAVKIPIPNGDIVFSASESEEDSTAGSAQNALDYLKSEGMNTGQATATETEATPPAGTLNIQDLLHAQGVGGSDGHNTGTADPGADKPPDETTTGKDGGGF